MTDSPIELKSINEIPAGTTCMWIHSDKPFSDVYQSAVAILARKNLRPDQAYHVSEKNLYMFSTTDI